MNFINYFKELIALHPNITAGILGGLLVGLVVLIFGFWKALFLLICVGIGFIWGFAKENGTTLKDLVQKFFNKQG